MSAMKDKKYKHTQQEIALKFGFSISTVSLAIEAPSQIGAINKTSKFFVLANFSKLLYFWATHRNLYRDIIYKSFVNLPVSQIEGYVPSDCIYGGYSAGKILLKEPPADYSTVHIYAEESQLIAIQTRFAPYADAKRGEPNFYVFKYDPFLKQYGNVTTFPHTFVDIWNLRDWYSTDFVKALEQKINGILS